MDFIGGVRLVGMTGLTDAEYARVVALLDGTASADERAWVDAWCTSDPANQALLEHLRRTKAALEQVGHDQLSMRMARLRDVVEAHVTMSQAGTRPLPSRVRFMRIGAVSALAVVALCVVMYAGRRWTTTPRPRAAQVYTTLPGQRRTILLADGTRVTLAPQTSLQVSARFADADRDVTLTGQAYFDVTTMNDHPFTVHTGDVTSRVLGTAFMVRRYMDEREIVVAVQSGKVSVARHNPVTLTSNTVAHVTDSTILLNTNADLREYMEWRDGQLVFTGARAAEVATVLGKWYGLKFQFADDRLRNRTISGSFSDRDSQQEVLQNLQFLLGVKMKFDGNVVTIIPQHAMSASPARQSVREEQIHTPTEVGR